MSHTSDSEHHVAVIVHGLLDVYVKLMKQAQALFYINESGSVLVPMCVKLG